MYKPQNQRASVRSSSNKKSVIFPVKNPIFEEESIEFNDFDSNILNRNMIKFLPTDSLRLELQLERAENKLKKIDEEIKAFNLFDFDEHEREEFLENKKKQLTKEINSYKSQYRALGFVYMIADVFSDIVKKIKDLINKIINYFLSYSFVKIILKKFPGYTEKEKLKKLNLLQKTISQEINKSANADTKKLEYLFQKTEEFN